MKEYNKTIFFKNKSESDKMYTYIIDYVSRSLLFSNVNGYLLDTNIYYEDNEYYLIYNLSDFKKVNIGESKKFYLPSWLKLKIYSNGLINGYGEAIGSFESNLSGYYIFKKINNRKRAVLLGKVKISDYDSLIKLESLENLYDAESIKIKSTAHIDNQFTLRNKSFNIIFRLLQRPKYSKYNISIELNINQLSEFFSLDYPFLKSSTWDERQFMLDLDPVEILVSSKYVNCPSSFHSKYNKLIDLNSWDNIIEYMNTNSSLSKYSKIYDKENNEVYLYYKNGKPKFKIKLLDVKKGI